jgi:hypothetical protein
LHWVIGDFERGQGQLSRDEASVKLAFEAKYRALQERASLSVEEVFSQADLKEMQEEVERLKAQVELMNAMGEEQRGGISDAPIELMKLLTELYDLAKAQMNVI